MPLSKRSRVSGETLEDIAMSDNLLIDMGYAKEKIESLGKTIFARKGKDAGHCIFIASSNGDCESLEKLLVPPTPKVALDYVRPKSLNSPIHKAAQYGHTYCVRMLIESGATIDPFNKKGETPLHQAVENNHAASIMVLIQHGANPNHISSCSGQSPLHVAVRMGLYRCFGVLLETKVAPYFIRSDGTEQKIEQEALDVDTRTSKGETALHLCSYDRGAFRKKSVFMAESIIEYGSDVNVADNEGNTPLHAAASYGSVGICKLLVSHNAAKNVPNSCGKTPVEVSLSKLTDDLLFEAIERQLLHSELVSLLRPLKSITRMSKDTPRPIALLRRNSETEVGSPERALSEDFSISKENELILCVSFHIINPPREYVHMTLDKNWTIFKVLSFVRQFLRIVDIRPYSIYLADYLQLDHVEADHSKKLSDYNFECKADIIFKQISLPSQQLNTPTSKRIRANRRRSFFTSYSPNDVTVSPQEIVLPTPESENGDQFLPTTKENSSVLPTMDNGRSFLTCSAPKDLRAPTIDFSTEKGSWEKVDILRSRSRVSTRFLAKKVMSNSPLPENLLQEEPILFSKRDIVLQNEIIRTRNINSLASGDSNCSITLPFNKFGCIPSDIWIPSNLRELNTMKTIGEPLLLTDRVKRRHQTDVRKKRLARLLEFYQITLPKDMPLSISLHLFNSFVMYGEETINETLEVVE